MRLLPILFATIIFFQVAPEADSQTYMEAVDVSEVKNTYVSSPDEIEIIDVKSALLSADNETFSVLLGQCLFPLVEQENDIVLDGLKQAGGSGFREVTFAARLLDGERVDITERAPLPCKSNDYRAVIITRMKAFGADEDSIEIQLLSLKPDTANMFANMTKSPDPEMDGFSFSSLPNGYSNDNNTRIVMNMRDLSVPEDQATPDDQQKSEDIIGALLEYGVRYAVTAIIGI